MEIEEVEARIFEAGILENINRRFSLPYEEDGDIEFFVHSCFDFFSSSH